MNILKIQRVPRNNVTFVTIPQKFDKELQRQGIENLIAEQDGENIIYKPLRV